MFPTDNTIVVKVQIGLVPKIFKLIEKLNFECIYS